MTAANQSTSTNGSESSNPKCGGEGADGIHTDNIIGAGYKAYNGYVFKQEEAEAYNRYTRDIQRTIYPQTREILLDQRHAFFVRTIAKANS